MKIKEGYILRDVGDSSVVVAVGKEAANFKGVITLNESAKVLWEALAKGATMRDLQKSLTDVYDVSDEKALESAQGFVAKLKEANVIID